MSKMVVYAQSDCNACRELVPILEKLTKQSGITMEIIDVDKCHTKKCDSVKFTPTIILDGKEIKSGKQLKKILEMKIKEKRSVRKHAYI